MLVGGIFGLFGFGGLMVWKGVVLGDPYPWLVALAWPVLFLSLGWNFLQYALSAPAEEGIVWGWLIPGVLFVIMGGAPLLAALPWGHTGRAGAARSRLASSVAPRSAQLDYERTDLATMMTKVLGERTGGSHARTLHQHDTTHTQTRLVSELERLAALHRAGDLSYDEFERAKKALIAEAGG